MITTVVSFFIWPREQQLVITPDVMSELQVLCQADTFSDLPGVNVEPERERMRTALSDLLSRLMQGVEANPRKSWVIAQMKPTVAGIYLEDTEARERFVEYLKQILAIFSIESTNGAFIRYLIFI
ncbi:MAG: DUF4844 domain-containing protein [Ramlibacter sp.]